jgi:cell division protein FtsN
MFALLFDRKSGILTLLALGAIGLMLFAAGLVTGVNVSWEKLASHMPHDRPQEPAAAPAPPAAAPEEEPAAAAWSRPRAEPRRNAPRESAEQAAFTRREPTSPPPGWVPLTEGAPWPGDEAAAASAPADPIVTAQEAADAHYFVQAGTFPDEAGAEEMRTGLAARCQRKGYAPYVETVWDRYGRRLAAVRLGPFPNEAAAQEVSNGMNGSLVGWASGRGTL